ncbi:MAG: UDP-3-O-acyl-N-acetylglucosamine deacetylase [Alphaproteobacteria bacterium MarineAlpha9_Bin4]|nr:UDP-3-O-[3-hydroxymyristoyl] N-acetylglucosamine deacetylase [Pelagibacterales bacterium]PPR27678.1 MAG: UDP-3-O-acyl-N-acetylglucosamine deacetylase [Alphaproteobacteria bacterium MarineAlpha9_Bin4]|tara:strand:+ start:532 stop:1452 length:921 start_codon:yes stop_codon:yes gene_type:complete
MKNNYKVLQRTIAKPISFSGIGLHSGDLCNITLKPADPDTGIVFIRKDLENNNIIPADYRYIFKSNLCTTLKAYNSDAKVITVEHLLAAIKGNGIDNLKIELDSKEIPILDGSSKDFDIIIKNVSTVEQKNKYKKYLIIKNKVQVKNKNSTFEITPSNNFEINCTVNFPDPIGIQEVSLGKNLLDIYNNVKDAKTFCFYEDIETMKKNGLAKGGSLKNAIVIKDGKILNSNFKYKYDYFAKHKILDIIGDLSLMGLNIVGNLSVYYPGHELNRLGMQQIFSNYNNFSIYQYNKSKEFISQENILMA